MSKAINSEPDQSATGRPVSYFEKPHIMAMLDKLNKTPTGRKRRATLIAEFERHDRWFADASREAQAQKAALIVQEAVWDRKFHVLTGGAIQ